MGNASEITLTIQDVAFGGDGVGRWEGKVVFVPGVLPGEQVRAKIVEEKKNFARAELLQVLEASPDRQESPCPFFGPCPGCRYLHVKYDAQLKLKAKQITDLLSRIGKISNLPALEVIGAASALEYRNKIKLHVEKTAAAWKVGYVGEDNRSIVDIDRCRIARPEIDPLLKNLRRQVAEEKGDFKGVWLARSDAKGGARDFLFQEGKEQYEELPLLKEEVQGKNFLSPFESFFQTHSAMLEKLVETAERKLHLTPQSFFVDAFCGVGLFTLLFAKKAASAVGIEEDRRAIGCARQNARILFVKNAEFIAEKVEAALSKLLKEHIGEEISVLLDPPRLGCHPQVLQILLKQPVHEIVYVSCNPATLARDLGVLCAEKYRLDQITFLDMFPQTAHAETVCRLVPA